MRYQMIEGNGGQLSMFIWDSSHSLRFGLTNLEYLSSEDFLETLDYIEQTSETEALAEIATWGSLIMDVDAQIAYDALPDNGFGWQLIAHNPTGKRKTYPDRMGSAGMIAFFDVTN